jgi:hypothetical protein
MNRRVIVAALCLLWICAGGVWTAAVAQQEGPVSTGVIVSIHGEVEVDRAGDRSAIDEGFVLMGGDTIIVKSGAHCGGFTPQGESFEIDGPVELELPDTAGEGVIDNVSRWVQRQLADWIGEGRRRPLTTRGGRDWSLTDEAPSPIIPAPDGAVRSGRPQLHWSTVPGVDRYQVTLAPEVGDEILRSVRDNNVTIEELEPGAQYVWKVGPDIEGWGGHGGWRGFRVLTHDEEAQLDEALKGLDDIAGGVLLLSVGLHDEAIYRFDAATASGTDVRSARLWRAQALADCGLYKQAYEDLIQLRGLN